ncbi:hypothetical protein NYE40_03830 [Paenibacillus sp. FSL W8-1187]|uniref:hypothetical protein n=1 Tax=unclassified Paenibacillus TaxID=185978 RepID=UPI00129A5E43|nr:hypothetical protein [Paenibacillus sp. B01]QGG54767.1 hypothetical protein GE073_03610 [Paenibacillus sp. B01]
MSTDPQNRPIPADLREEEERPPSYGRSAPPFAAEHEAAASLAAQGASAKGMGGAAAARLKQVDGRRLAALLRDPLQGLREEPERDSAYGWIGLGASVLGFLVWTLFMQKALQGLFYSLFGFGGLFAYEPGFDFGLALRMLLGGALSLAALLGSLYLFGSRFGSRKRSLLQAAVPLGAMQLLSGAGFAAAGIAALASIRLSLLLLVVTLLVTLATTVTGTAELFEVRQERRFAFIAASIASYAVVLLVLFSLLF